MANEIFHFENPDTGEEIYRCTARQGAMNRAKLYLFNGADPKGNYQADIWIALWGFLSAKAAGHPVVELPAPRQITPKLMLDLMDEVSVFYEVETDEDGTKGEDGTENPTAPSDES